MFQKKKKEIHLMIYFLIPVLPIKAILSTKSTLLRHMKYYNETKYGVDTIEWLDSIR